MTEIVNVRNTKRGTVGSVSRRIFEHPVLNPGILVEVESDAKPYIPELYKPRTAEEYLSEKAAPSNDPEPDKAEVDTKQKDSD